MTSPKDKVNMIIDVLDVVYSNEENNCVEKINALKELNLETVIKTVEKGIAEKTIKTDKDIVTYIEQLLQD